jgi:ribonuclease PH
LNYEEDSKAEVDMNIVKTGSGGFVEIQGTAEDAPFSAEELAGMMAVADKGIQELIAIQRKAVGEVALKKRKPPKA